MVMGGRGGGSTRATIADVSELVRRYLDQILREHAGDTAGKLADYIPELAAVDPAGFAITLSSSTARSMKPVISQHNSPSSRCRSRSPTRWRWTSWGKPRWTPHIGVQPSGEAFNQISVDRTTRRPKNPMISAGAIAAVALVPGADDERFDNIRGFSRRRAAR